MRLLVEIREKCVRLLVKIKRKSCEAISGDKERSV